MKNLSIIVTFNTLLSLAVFGQSVCNSDFYFEHKDSICSILKSRIIEEDTLKLIIIPYSEKLNFFAAPNYIFDVIQKDTVAFIFLDKHKNVIDIFFNRPFDKGKYAVYFTKHYNDKLGSLTEKEIIFLLNKRKSFEIKKSVIVR